MGVIVGDNIFHTYKNEYGDWRNDKKLQEAKRQEYLRQNPNEINVYDLKRAKVLLDRVDMMDKAVSVNSDHLNTFVDTITGVGLGYAAILGAATGMLFQKWSVVDKAINHIVKKNPKSANIFSMGITIAGGVLGMIAAYPAYAFLSNIESKIDRKKQFDTMENELRDFKTFVALDKNQEDKFNKNLSKLDRNDIFLRPNIEIKKPYRTLKKAYKEILNYDNAQTKLRNKYETDESLYDKELTQKEITNAKKDKVLLCILIKELNTKSQNYAEKMQKITDNIVTLSFSMGSILALGYERITKNLKLKSSAVPAGLGLGLMLSSTFFATWATKRAAHIGRFKAKQDLINNPERLIFINQDKTQTINEENINIEKNKEITTIQFLKRFFKYNKEYEEWKKTPSLSGTDISRAMENIELTEEQIQDGKRLKENLFKTFYKVDSNTQNYSSKIDLIRESVKYPMVLILGSIGSLLGTKNLIKIRNTTSANEVFRESVKYVGTISLFTFPVLLINSYFANIKKMGARISDMMTMKTLEDYRFFADYSRYKKENH